MKKLFIIVSLFTLMSICDAQVVGGGGTITPVTTTQQSKNKLITAANITFLSGASAGAVYMILGGCFFDDGLDALLWAGIGIFGASLIAATPMWIVGSAQRRSQSTSYTQSLINYDFEINKNLTLSANLNVTHLSKLAPMPNSMNSYCPGAGLALHF